MDIDAEWEIPRNHMTKTTSYQHGCDMTWHRLKYKIVSIFRAHWIRSMLLSSAYHIQMDELRRIQYNVRLINRETISAVTRKKITEGI